MLYSGKGVAGPFPDREGAGVQGEREQEVGVSSWGASLTWDGGTLVSSVMEGVGDGGGLAGDFHGTCGRVPELVATYTFWVAYEFDEGSTVPKLLGATRLGMMYVRITVKCA